MKRKILSLVVAFGLLLQQVGYAQLALDASRYVATGQQAGSIDSARPLQMRYFSFDTSTNRIDFLIDKGDIKVKEEQERQAQELFNYFLIGLSLPNESFWVNLRPDSPDNIIDQNLAQTDVGKVFLEADLQLKKDTALLTSPQNPAGKQYWTRLYKKAEELLGGDSVNIPTLTRPWIVPGEVVVRYNKDSAYVYKATLKVMLEQDYLKGSTVYNFSDDRLKQLNEYSAELVRELILPELTKIVNSGKRYAQLRQVYHSLILAQWFKSHYNPRAPQRYVRLIDSRNLDGLTSGSDWSVRTYFEQYKTSFQKGEYNIKQAHSGLSGKSMRSYFSGGIKMSSSPVAASMEVTSAVAGRLRGELMRTGNFLTFSPETGVAAPVKTSANNRRASSPITSEDFRTAILPALIAKAIDDNSSPLYEFLRTMAPLEAKEAAESLSPREAKELKDLRKAFSRLLDSINADSELSHEIREGKALDVNTPEIQERYAAKAREYLASGKVAFLLLFGGEATRLGLGSMYGIDIVKVARHIVGYPTALTKDEIDKIDAQFAEFIKGLQDKEAEKLGASARTSGQIREQYIKDLTEKYRQYETEFGTREGKDRILPTMGQRHNFALRDAFLAMFAPDALKKTKLIVVPNESIQKQVMDDFSRPDHNYYGFSRENVYFMDAPRWKPYTLSRVHDRKRGEDSHVVVTNNSVSEENAAAPNHGLVMYQLGFEGEAYNVDHGRDRLGKPLIDKLVEDGVEVIVTRRINDFELWDTDPENVLGVQQLAAILYCMDQGVEMVSEVLVNDGTQKGGLLLWKPGMTEDDSIIFEGLSGQSSAWQEVLATANSRVNNVTNGQRKGVFYNRFNQAVSARAIQERITHGEMEDLRVSTKLRMRPGGVQLETPFGEFSYILQHRGIYRPGALIKDFKAFNNLPAAVVAAGEQTRTYEDNYLQGRHSSMKVSSPITNGRSASSPIDRDENAPWEFWMGKPLVMDDFNPDMFRDYDYRSTGPGFKPEMAFRFGLVWARMALEKARAAGITNRKVVIARDARKIESELPQALADAFRYAGLDVVYVAADGPNAVTSYSWAVQEHKPLMSVFITASHVSRPKNEIVRGFKVAMLTKSGGSLQSLTTREIKETSKPVVVDLIKNPSHMEAMHASRPGTFAPSNIVDNCIKFNSLIGEVAAQGGSLFELARAIESSDNPAEVLRAWRARFGSSQPLRGVKVVVEGAHTPSGMLASGTFESLGARTVLINGDIQEIEGEHNADPSKDKNLQELKDAIIREGAGFGIAFDLDGDRGAIVVPQRQPDGTIGFETLSPDNLLVILQPSLVKKYGYDASVINKKIGVIRDVLGTFGVNDSAERLGVEAFQTDAGYVFLKALRAKLLEQGYVIPVYGERSGHCWLDVSGEIENPVAVAVLFAVMVKQEKYTGARAQSEFPFIDTYNDKTIPYAQSPRFQPPFHPRLLVRLSSDSRNDTGWSYDPASQKSPPQAIIALGKDVGVRAIIEYFFKGRSFNSSIGAIQVRSVNTYKDVPEDGNLYRFADIVFETQDGRLAGRFVFRASSNDPTFVCSYEAPVYSGQSATDPMVAARRAVVGGIVLDWMQKDGFALISKDVLKQQLGVTDQEADKKSKDLNLGPVENDLAVYSGSSPISAAQYRSSSPVTEKDLGGIDFASIPVTSQFSPAALLPVPGRLLSASERDQERIDLEAMVASGIIPSSDRVWEYTYSTYQDATSPNDLLKATACIANVLRLEEELGIVNEPGTMQALAVLEGQGYITNSYVDPDED